MIRQHAEDVEGEESAQISKEGGDSQYTDRAGLLLKRGTGRRAQKPSGGGR